MFLFEAQTGICSLRFTSSRSLPVYLGHSNYYRFLLDDEHRRWVEEIVSKAELTSAGFVYDHLTLERLHARDLRPVVALGRLVLDG